MSPVIITCVTCVSYQLHVLTLCLMDVVVDLDCNVLKVRQLLENTLILNMTVERVAVWAFVWVLAAVSIVVELGVGVQVVGCSVSSAVCYSNYQVEWKAPSATLGEQKSVGNPKSALIFFKIKLSVVLQGLFCPVHKESKAWDIRNSYRGFSSPTLDVVVARVYC